LHYLKDFSKLYFSEFYSIPNIPALSAANSSHLISAPVGVVAILRFSSEFPNYFVTIFVTCSV
jgi:hypothetical protein